MDKNQRSELSVGRISAVCVTGGAEIGHQIVREGSLGGEPSSNRAINVYVKFIDPHGLVCTRELTPPRSSPQRFDADNAHGRRARREEPIGFPASGTSSAVPRAPMMVSAIDVDPPDHTRSRCAGPIEIGEVTLIEMGEG